MLTAPYGIVKIKTYKTKLPVSFTAKQLTGAGFSWESDSSSAGQEIPGVFWNPIVHERVHKFPSNPLYVIPFCFAEVHFNLLASEFYN